MTALYGSTRPPPGGAAELQSSPHSVHSAPAGVTEDTLCVGVARLGADDQLIQAATLQQLASCDLGGPLHSLVVSGRLHPLEVDMLRVHALPGALEQLQTLDSSTYWS